MIQTATIIADIIEEISNEYKEMKEIDALKTQAENSTATPRLVVTSSWYLRWRWMAKNLSTVKVTTPKNDFKANKLLSIKYALLIVS